MATSRKRNVEIDVVVDDAKARAKLKNIGDGAEQTGGRFQKMGALAKGAMALVAGSQIVDFLRDAAVAAMEDEKSQRLLALALENTHGATESQIASTERFIAELSKAAGIADDELRPALGELARTHGTIEEAQDALAVALDISAAKGMDLDTVVRAMGKAALGQVGALGRLGLATRDASGEMLDYEGVLREAERTMGGSFAAAAETAEGQMRKAQVAWDEAKESLGAAFLPVLSDVVDTLAETVDGFQDLGNVDPNLEGNDLLEWASAIRRGAEAIGLVEEAAKPAKSETAKLSREMDIARHAAKRQREETNELSDALLEQQRVTRELIDPVFALWRSTQRVRDAQRNYTDILIRQGPKSREAQDAAVDLAAAQLDAEAAAQTFAVDGGTASIDALRELARRAGLSESAIADLIAEIERLNRTPVNTPGRHRSRTPGGSGGDQEFASGGVVGGTPGTPQLITAHAGEVVLSRSQAAGSGVGDGSPIILQLNVDGRKFYEEVILPQQIRAARRGIAV